MSTGEDSGVHEYSLSDEEFAKFTLYFATNNPADNRKRALVLGFTKPGIKVRTFGLQLKLLLELCLG